MISPITNSATERELENGELNTTIPFFAACTRSTWLVPIQKHPMTSKFFAASRTLAVSLVFDLIPMAWTSLNLDVSPMFHFLIDRGGAEIFWWGSKSSHSRKKKISSRRRGNEMSKKNGL